jgi:hypothetical protein
VTGGSVLVKTGTEIGQSYVSVTNTGTPGPEVEGVISVRTVHPSGCTGLRRPGRRARTSIVASVVTARRGHLQADALPKGGLKMTLRFVIATYESGLVRPPSHLPLNGTPRVEARARPGG